MSWIVAVFVLLHLWHAQCQAVVKGGMIASTLKLTAINNQTSSLVFGSSTNEIKMSASPDKGFVIETTTAPLMCFKSDNTIEVGAQEMTIKSSLSVDGLFRVGGVSQWRLVHVEDFTAKQAVGWDNKNTELVTECAGIFMLGGYGMFAKGEVTKRITELPSHDQIRIKANFHFIDAWIGQSGFMRLSIGKDGSMVHVWTDRHNQDTEEFAVDVCGGGTGEGKFSVPIEVTLPHSTDSISIGFGSTIETDDPTDQSWGVSAIEVFVR